MKLKVTVNGIDYDVDVEVEEEPIPDIGSILLGTTSSYGITPTAAKATALSSNALTAPISGTVVTILVSEGDTVKGGDTVVVLEAMKMETEITAPAAGKVSAVLVAAGDPVQGGQTLIQL